MGLARKLNARWKEVQGHLGVTNSIYSHKPTWGCLRGSGTVQYYYSCEEVARRIVMQGLSSSSRNLYSTLCIRFEADQLSSELALEFQAEFRIRHA